MIFLSSQQKKHTTMHSPEEEDSIEIVKVPVGSGMFYAINQDELVATTQEKTILTYKRTDHFKEMIKMMCENEKNSSSNEQITQTETVQYYDDNKFMKNCDKIIKKSTIVNQEPQYNDFMKIWEELVKK